MDAQLQSFLAECHLQVQELVTWSRQIQLQVNSYLGPSLPPLNFITSVRSILMREQTVLVIRDPERLHILPGGRVERGETLEQAIRRELREETGWTLNRITYLGFEHFHHVTAKPAGYRYPYPDFCQAVYAAQADTFSSEGKETNGYELETTFCSIPEVYTLSLTDSERLFLNALLERGDASPG